MISSVQLRAAARRSMWDVSTSHLTWDDNLILTGRWYNELPRSVYHQRGCIVFITGSDSAVPALRERRLSETFIDLYMHACRDKDVMLINFDQDAQVLPGLPTFDW